jgi:transporter family-2 protein
MTFMSTFIVILVGAAGGLAAAIQSQAQAVMEERVGTLAGTFVTYGLGGLVIALAMLLFGRSRLSDVTSLPLWVYGAGIMGLVIVSSLGITAARFGLAAGLTLFTAAALVFGAVIDQFGLLGEARHIDITKGAGLLLVIVGTWLTVGTGS